MSYSAEDIARLRADLEKLRAARASGIKRVTMGGRTMEFHDPGAMREAEMDLERRIAGATGGRRRRSSVMVVDCG